MSTTTDNPTKRRLQILSNWQEPALFKISCDRAHEAMQAAAPHLRQLWNTDPQAATIRQRTVEVREHLDPQAARLCWHQIGQALSTLWWFEQSIDSDYLSDIDPYAVRLENFLDMITSRIEPAFARSDLWDADAMFRRRYDAWVKQYLADMPPSPEKREMYPYAVEVFRKHSPKLAGLFREMIKLFPWGEDQIATLTAPPEINEAVAEEQSGDLRPPAAPRPEGSIPTVPDVLADRYAYVPGVGLCAVTDKGERHLLSPAMLTVDRVKPTSKGLVLTVTAHRQPPASSLSCDITARALASPTTLIGQLTGKLAVMPEKPHNYMKQYLQEYAQAVMD